ncbi:hypothetical protein [Nonomuraea salmonea]|uniref:Uncharacterized protein n=1 Tax=Nonomuraea salmonea TaxID=46181 RepID=A0ABV5NY90_9ACTN
MDGQDEGRLSGFVTNGQDVLRRNPLSSFPAGPPTPPCWWRATWTSGSASRPTW